LDLKEDLDALDASRWGGEKSKASSSSQESDIRGWSSAQHSRIGRTLGDSLRVIMLNLRLRIEPGVAGLLNENIECASPSNDGTESLESERS
jgi:hypothetical protein